MSRHLFLKSFVWAVSITSLFVITLCAGLVSLIVGDWIIIHTENPYLAWGVGIFVFLGFLCSLGACIGIWIWLRVPSDLTPVSEDTMTKVLADISSSERD